MKYCYIQNYGYTEFSFPSEIFLERNNQQSESNRIKQRETKLKKQFKGSVTP